MQVLVYLPMPVRPTLYRLANRSELVRGCLVYQKLSGWSAGTKHEYSGRLGWPSQCFGPEGGPSCERFARRTLRSGLVRIRAETTSG